MKIKRFKSPLHQWWWEYSLKWKHDRFANWQYHGKPWPIYRIRFWPIHALQIFVAWLLFNVLVLGVYPYGTESLWTKPDSWQKLLYAPLYWLKEYCL